MSGCSCCGGVKLLFSCSGSADVGELADVAARKLNQETDLNMFCLAGIGGKVPGIIKTTEAADKIVIIDGCPINCAKKSLDEAGIDNYEHIQLADLGFEKGKSAVTTENIMKVYNKALN